MKGLTLLGSVTVAGIVLSVSVPALANTKDNVNNGQTNPVCQQGAVDCISSHSSVNQSSAGQGGNQISPEMQLSKSTTQQQSSTNQNNTDNLFCTKAELSALVNKTYDVNISAKCLNKYIESYYPNDFRRVSFINSINQSCSDDDKDAIIEGRKDVVVNRNCVRHIVSVLSDKDSDGNKDANQNKTIIDAINILPEKIGLEFFKALGNATRSINETLSSFFNKSGSGSDNNQGKSDGIFSGMDPQSLVNGLLRSLTGLGGNGGGLGLPTIGWSGGLLGRPMSPLELAQNTSWTQTQRISTDVNRFIDQITGDVNQASKELVDASKEYNNKVMDASSETAKLLSEAEQTLKDLEGKDKSIDNELTALKAILKGVVANGKIDKAGYKGIITAFEKGTQGIMSLQLAGLALQNAELEALGAISAREAAENQAKLREMRQIAFNTKKYSPSNYTVTASTLASTSP